jgi:hypothetical protein
MRDDGLTFLTAGLRNYEALKTLTAEIRVLTGPDRARSLYLSDEEDKRIFFQPREVMGRLRAAARCDCDEERGS